MATPILDELSSRYFNSDAAAALEAIGPSALLHAKSYVAGTNNAMEPFKQDVAKALAANPDNAAIATLLGDDGAQAIQDYKEAKTIEAAKKDSGYRVRAENRIKDLAGGYLAKAKKEGAVDAESPDVEPPTGAQVADAATKLAGAQGKDAAAIQADLLIAHKGNTEPFKQDVLAAVEKAATKKKPPFEPLDAAKPDYEAVAQQRLDPADAANIQTVLGKDGLKLVGQYLVGREVEAATKDSSLRVAAENGIKDRAGDAGKKQASLEPEKNGVRVADAGSPAVVGVGTTKDRAIG